MNVMNPENLTTCKPASRPSRTSSGAPRCATQRQGRSADRRGVGPPGGLVEDDKQYLIKAELPQVTKADVKVTVQDDVLTITGERTFEKEANGTKYHRVERAYGRFGRSFTMPEDADGNGVVAEYKDGVLEVHLPKSEKAKPKTIEVKIG